MKVIIDIPEEVYEEIQTKFLNTKVNNITLTDRAIYNGTPLPKGHGRLIDADVLVDGMEDDYEFCEAVNATPTIIESDKR